MKPIRSIIARPNVTDDKTWTSHPLYFVSIDIHVSHATYTHHYHSKKNRKISIVKIKLSFLYKHGS